MTAAAGHLPAAEPALLSRGWLPGAQVAPWMVAVSFGERFEGCATITIGAARIRQFINA